MLDKGQRIEMSQDVVTGGRLGHMGGIWEVSKVDETRQKLTVRKVGKRGALLAVSPTNNRRISFDMARKAKML